MTITILKLQGPRALVIPRHSHRSTSIPQYVIVQYVSTQADADAYIAKQAHPSRYITRV